MWLAWLSGLQSCRFWHHLKSRVADVIMPFRPRYGMAVDFKAEMTIITSVNK